jgi:Ca-activated chloride channel family protein
MQNLHFSLGLNFSSPELLWFLALVPLFVGFTFWLARSRSAAVHDQFGEPELIARFNQKIPVSRLIAKAVAVALCLACLVLALSRPTMDSGKTEFPMGTIDVIAVVDVSRSMAVPDYRGKLPQPYADGRRLDMAKFLLMKEVVGSLNYNRLGVVTFSGEAFPLAFLTEDLSALKWVLNRAMTVGSAPGEGSELGKAFDMAFRLFDLDSKPSHRRVIVLFSDGGNDSELAEMNGVVKELKKRDIDLIIVGLGKTSPSAIPVDMLSPSDQRLGRGQQWYEVKGEIVTSKLEENVLLLLKNATRGRYVRLVEVNDFSMTSMVSRMEVKHVPGQYELFPWLLLVSALAFVAAVLISNEPDERKFKGKPAQERDDDSNRNQRAEGREPR